MTIDATSSLVDVAFAVCTALHRAGTTTVLTGGSAATYYAPDAYQSSDLDFVITFNANDAGEQALFDLGFERAGDFYRHRASHFPLEFPPGPLMVGGDAISEWNTDKRGDQMLHVLSATDCCRDRLAAFFFWNDFSALEQALAVCRAHRTDVDLATIQTWSQREHAAEKYRLFTGRLGDEPL